MRRDRERLNRERLKPRAPAGKELHMYAYFQGNLAEKSEDGVVVECGGVGYNILVGANVLDSLPAVGSEVRIYTYTAVREDAIQLFGFLSREDVKLFRLLITVSGIGPKGALSILSALGSEKLRFAVVSQDADTIAKAPGIGKKTAQKLVIELKDKLKTEGEAELPQDAETGLLPGISDAGSEAVQALVALGYPARDAIAAVKKSALPENSDVELLLKEALRTMALI